MKKNKNLALIMTLGLVVVSCTNNDEGLNLRLTQTEANFPPPFTRTSPTLIQNPLYTSTPKISVTGDLKSLPTQSTVTKKPYTRMPDLVINYGPNVQNYLNGYYLCDGKPQVFVLFSKYPYSDFTFISQKNNFDQNFPSWANDGERIAYIESDPEPYFDFDSDPVKKIGLDHIKIIDSQGIIQKESMQSLVRMDYHSIENSCQPKSLIYDRASWSSDDQYMVFSYVDWGDPFIHRRYLLNVITDSIEIMIEDTANWDDAIWFTDQNKFVDFDEKGLLIVTILSGGLFSKEHFPWPNGYNGDDTTYFTFIQENPIQVEDDYYKVSGIFTKYDKINQEIVYNSESVWKFNLDLKVWEKIESLNQHIKDPIILDENYLVGCNDNDQLIIHNIRSQGYSEKQLPVENRINCNTFHIFQDDSGKKGVSFWVSGEQGGLWIIDPKDPNAELFQIIHQENLPDISKEVPEDIFVPPFSFMNVVDYDWRSNQNN